MIASNEKRDDFLAALKASCRSSPQDWNGFHLFLMSKKLSGQKNPPVPLILAASCESNATKHDRLTAQLLWAEENRCLEEALQYLKAIPNEEWNSCSPGNWFQSNYPS